MAGSFDLDDPLSSPTPSTLFSAEPSHSISLPSLIPNLPLRRATASLLLPHRPRALAYLAINYLDRFLSTRRLPNSKPWLAPLLAAACLSLASKMYRLDPPSPDLDRRAVSRMETAVLAALQWRMRSITPFSFLGFLLGLLGPGADPALLAALRSRASGLLFAAQNDLRLAGIRPSVVAASAILAAARELLPARFGSLRDAMASCPYLRDDGEALRECSELVSDLAAEDEDGASSSRETPVSVLTGHQHRGSFEVSSEIQCAADSARKKARLEGGGDRTR